MGDPLIEDAAAAPVHVRLRGPDQMSHVLPPGAIVGRAPSAGLPVDDPRVSEAHALVSLRRGQLYLLALRRRFYVGGRPVSEARLRRGLDLDLVPSLTYRVEAVTRPKRVVVIEGAGLGSRVITGVVTIVGGTQARVVGRYERGDAHVWDMGGRWRLRLAGGQTRELAVGDHFEVAGTELTLSSVPVETLGCATTRGATEAERPLRLVASYDTVELRADGRPVSHVNGVCGRVLAELVAFGGPVSWQVVAGEVWPGSDAEAPEVRHRWDVTLSRLRKKLRDAGVRRNLVQTDGSGQVWLVLFEGDTAVDRS